MLYSPGSICCGSTDPDWHNLNINTINAKCKSSYQRHSSRRFKSSPESLTVLSGSTVLNDWMIMNDELERILKEAVMA
jgi:hypothetical protein